MSHLFILKNKKVIGIDDVLVWGKWFEDIKNRRILETTIGKYWISTVFLGLDHNFGLGEPLYFETMVFNTKNKTKCKIGKTEIESVREDLDMERYSTYKEAEEGHKKLVEKWTKVNKVNNLKKEE